jgi:hypothetical protein
MHDFANSIYSLSFAIGIILKRTRLVSAIVLTKSHSQASVVIAVNVQILEQIGYFEKAPYTVINRSSDTAFETSSEGSGKVAARILIQ